MHEIKYATIWSVTGSSFKCLTLVLQFYKSNKHYGIWRVGYKITFGTYANNFFLQIGLKNWTHCMKLEKKGKKKLGIKKIVKCGGI